jgi:hypothetical protein
MWNVLSVYHFDSGENYKKNRVKSKVKYESLGITVNTQII